MLVGSCLSYIFAIQLVTDLSFVLLLGENINLSWSPDGQTIAVGNKEDLITFIDVRTNKTKFVEQFKLEVNEFSWNKDGTLFFLTTGQGSIIIHRYHKY